jgi:hypothetical protein
MQTRHFPYLLGRSPRPEVPSALRSARRPMRAHCPRPDRALSKAHRPPRSLLSHAHTPGRNKRQWRGIEKARFGGKSSSQASKMPSLLSTDQVSRPRAILALALLHHSSHDGAGPEVLILSAGMTNGEKQCSHACMVPIKSPWSPTGSPGHQGDTT